MRDFHHQGKFFKVLNAPLKSINIIVKMANSSLENEKLPKNQKIVAYEFGRYNVIPI